jgi:hypothetical protein
VVQKVLHGCRRQGSSNEVLKRPPGAPRPALASAHPRPPTPVDWQRCAAMPPVHPGQGTTSSDRRPMPPAPALARTGACSASARSGHGRLGYRPPRTGVPGQLEQRPPDGPVHAVLVQQPVSIWEIGRLERHVPVVGKDLPGRPRRQLLHLQAVCRDQRMENRGGLPDGCWPVHLNPLLS